MIDSNNKLKSLSKSLIESARKIMTEKKEDKDLAKLAPPYDKVTHADVLVGRKVYTHDQVKAHKAKKGIKEDADMVVVNAPVLSDINGELAEVLKRDPRDKSVHVQLEGMKYILKKGQYEELDEAVKNAYAIGMAAAMKATGDEPPLKKSTIVKAHKIAKKVAEEVEQIDELSKGKLTAYRTAAKKQGTGIQDKMKVGGGDWSKDGKDTDTLKKRMAGYKMAGRKTNPDLAATVGKAPKVVATEEAELDELYKTTLKSYIKKAGRQAANADDSAEHLRGLGDKWKDKMPKNNAYAAADKHAEKSEKRLKGIRKAVGKLDRGEYEPGNSKLTREEVEQIDELSTKTLKSYQRKATTSSERAWNKADKEEDKAMSTDGTKYPEKQERHMKAAGDAIKTWRKREAGLGAVKKKLAKEEVELDEAYTIRSKGHENVEVVHKGKVVGRFNDPHSARMHIAKLNKNASVKEEVEELDELSRKTLGSYAQKAKTQLSRSEYLSGFKIGQRMHGTKPDAHERKLNQRANKRYAGLETAINKLAKEDVEFSDEEIQNLEAILADFDDESED